MESIQVLVVGGGLAGLGAASILDKAGLQFIIVEAQSRPGGLIRTDEVDGFLFDRSGHFLHFRSDTFREIVAKTEVPMDRVHRSSAVIFGDAIVPYPMQFNLWAIPRNLREAIVSEIEALHDVDKVCDQSFKDQSFKSALEATWGKTLTDIFFRPYNEKVWNQSLEALPADCGGRFMPKPDIDLVRQGAGSLIDGYGYNAKFQYPSSGQIGELAEALARPFEHRIRLNSMATDIDVNARQCRVNGQLIDYEYQINTDALSRVFNNSGIERLKPSLLDYSAISNIRVGFKGEMNCDDHWHYTPDPALPFFRVGYPRNVNPATCPPGHASLSIECSTPRSGKQDLDARKIARTALDYLQSKQVLNWSAVSVMDVCTIDPAYVAFRRHGRKEFDCVFSQLEERGIFMAGRFGEWDYLSAEDAFLSGMRAADRIVAIAGQKERPSSGSSVVQPCM